jgi:hypothetical protein
MKRNAPSREVSTYRLPTNPFDGGTSDPPRAPVTALVDAAPHLARGAKRGGADVAARSDDWVRKLSKSTGRVRVAEMFVTNESRGAARRRRAEAQALGRAVLRERTGEKRRDAKGRTTMAKDSSYLPMRGENRPQALRTYVPAKAPSVQVTANVAAMAYPFLAEAGLGSRGVLVGYDAWSGAAYVYDPFTLYERSVLTNPNMLIAGVIGRGKSALCKSLVTRNIAVGRRVFVPSDPKGEWTSVAMAVGGFAIELGGSSSNRLNPLDAPPRPSGYNDGDWVVDVRRRRRDLIGALTAASLERNLRAVEHTALDVALDMTVAENDVPLLRGVVERLLNPVHDMLGSTRQQLREDGRESGHALQRFVEGDLKGLFDGPSTVEFDPTMPMVSIDMSRIGGSDTQIAMVSTCAGAWMESALSDPNGGQRFLVYDEAWRLLKSPALLARMQSQWKMSRALGIANVMVIHRLSDLDAVGDENSESRNLALGLLADCSTKVIYAQERGEASATGRRLGLSEVEIEQLPGLARGQGLWRVGERSFLVNHRMTQGELALFDTNARMTTGESR